MQRNSLLLVVLSLAVLAVLGQTARAGRPNFLVVMTDDQAQWALGCYGNRDVKTPNMDRLAREGARFANAFTVTPVCSPSRASFFTGRYGTELGITDWINRIEADLGVGLPASGVPTWPALLKQAGYTTGLVGKWHLGETPHAHPTKQGFDYFFGFTNGGEVPMNPNLERDGKVRNVKGPIADIFGDDAIQFLETNKDKPFALCLFFREPHQPYLPMPEVDMAAVDGLDPQVPKAKGLDPQHAKDVTRRYYAATHAADRNFGRVLDKLDALKLTDNTVVLFTSDHGYCIGHHTVHTKGNGAWMAGGVEGPKRPNMFEESIRVPLLVRWPGVTKPGTVIDHAALNLDTFATLLSIAGVMVPPEVKQHGADLSPLLRGKPLPPRDAVFGQYDLHNGGFASMRMIRTPQWKLVRHQLTNGLNELYDLSSDPGETKNLYNDSASAKMRDALQEKLTAWQKSIDDPMLNNPLNTPAVGGPVHAQ